MSILIFFIVLSALVLVHELGHFIAAKLCKVSVHEFGFGFPPKLIKLFRWKETIFTLNALPFGGFVKMEGEDEAEHTASPKSFGSKHPAKKLFILCAGIIGNVLFAWFLIALVLGIGAPISSDTASKYNIQGSTHTVVLDVTTDSPAAIAGITAGTVLPGITPTALQSLVADSNGNPITLDAISKDNQSISYTITPQYDSELGMYKIGIASDSITEGKVSVLKAIAIGFEMTLGITKNVALGFVQLIGGLFTGTADTDSVTGPIGLVGIVGNAEKTGGIISLLMLTALISVNLAIINIVPFPALDGGRIFVTIIEWIRGKQFNQNILGKVHSIGFIILIAILVAVTIKDVKGLF